MARNVSASRASTADAHLAELDCKAGNEDQLGKGVSVNLTQRLLDPKMVFYPPKQCNMVCEMSDDENA